MAFNQDAINQLYDKILGIENATYNDIESALSHSATYSMQIILYALSLHNTNSIVSSLQFLPNNGGNNLIITLGGKRWIVTSLSTKDGGDPILTLMLADVAETSKWSQYVTNQYTYAKYPWTNYASIVTSDIFVAFATFLYISSKTLALNTIPSFLVSYPVSNKSVFMSVGYEPIAAALDTISIV